MRTAPARSLRIGAAMLAVVALLVVVLVIFNHAAAGPVQLQRLREPTLVFWLCVLTAALSRRDPGAAWNRWTDLAEAWLGSRRAFAVIAAAGLVCLVASSVTHHLAFDTYSHDLGMYQEVLWRAWERPPLASAILGSSFLGEHFSPVLFVIAPLYRLVPSPLTLVVLHAVLLWVAVLPLGAVGRELGVSVAVRNLVCAVYLFFPTVARAAAYPFHHEALYPVILLGLYLAFLRDRRAMGALLTLAAIAVKEDAGLYLVGMGVFFGLHHRRWRWGAPVAVAGAIATVAAVTWIIPVFAGDHAGYGFLGRWHPWVTVAGFSGAVRAMIGAIATEDFVTVIAATVLLPLRGRWTWTVVAIPLLVNLTSSTPIQAQLGLYYGLPFAAAAAIAATAALAERPVARPAGAKLAAVALVINIASLTYPSIPACRSAVLAELGRVAPSATVAMSGSFDPYLQRVAHRELIRADRQPSTDVVILRVDRFTWPLSSRQASGVATRLENSGAYEERFRCGGFLIFERRPLDVTGG